MNNLGIFVLVSVIYAAIGCVVHYFGGLIVLLIFIGAVGLLATVALILICCSARDNGSEEAGKRGSAPTRPPSHFPTPSLSRLLQQRPPARERDALTDTGRVVYRDLRDKVGGHSQPHSTKRHKLP